MSLASKVATLFSSRSTTAQPNSNDFAHVDDGVRGEKQPFAGVKLGSESFTSETMSSKTVEEEPRPLYLHVRHPRTSIQASS